MLAVAARARLVDLLLSFLAQQSLEARAQGLAAVREASAGDRFVESDYVGDRQTN